MGWFDRLSEESVTSAEAFCEYAQQEVGTRHSTQAVLKQVTKLQEKSNLDWAELVRRIALVKASKHRFDTAKDLMKAILDLTFLENEVE